MYEMSSPCEQKDIIRDIQKELSNQARENASLQTETKIMNQKIDKMDTKIDKNHQEILQKIDESIISGDKKYARKEEVDQIRKHIGNEEEIRKRNKQEVRKFWGIVISALLSALGVIVSVILK